jgi:hypothetical protein
VSVPDCSAAATAYSHPVVHEGYERLLADAGLRPIAIESRDADAAALAERVWHRLRAARIVGLDRVDGSPIATAEAIGLVGAARQAIADGALGYAIFVASG